MEDNAYERTSGGHAGPDSMTYRDMSRMSICLQHRHDSLERRPQFVPDHLRREQLLGSGSQPALAECLSGAPPLSCGVLHEQEPELNGGVCTADVGVKRAVLQSLVGPGALETTQRRAVR